MKYLGITLVSALLVFFILSGYGNVTKSSGKSTRLECHKQSVVFEKVYEQVLFKDARESLEQQNYILDSSVQKAHYMKSQLFEHVDIKEVDKSVIEAIEGYQGEINKDTDMVKLKYHIYENDKNDPGKKTQKSKRYAGYLKFDVVYKKQRVYAIQIDLMDMQGRDIPQRVNCAIKSIMKDSQ